MLYMNLTLKWSGQFAATLSDGGAVPVPHRLTELGRGQRRELKEQGLLEARARRDLIQDLDIVEQHLPEQMMKGARDRAKEESWHDARAAIKAEAEAEWAEHHTGRKQRAHLQKSKFRLRRERGIATEK